MSNKTNTKTRTNSKLPSHALYHVTDGKDDKSNWIRIGAAWPHKDGKGMSLQLDLLPRDGRIAMRIIDYTEATND